MTTSGTRVLILAGAATLVAGAMALGQDRKAATSGISAVASVDVFNSIEGRMVVAASWPEGAWVEQGQVVCELDATELQDRLTSQELMVRSAQAELQAAILAREAAGLAVNDFSEVGFAEGIRGVESAVKLAEGELARSEDQLEWTRRMFEKGYVSQAEKVSNELALRKSQFALEVAQLQKKRLIDFTKAKTTKELQAALETATARELARQAALEHERSTQKRLTEQVGRCKLVAPASGRVRYAVPIGRGAVVRDGQLLFSVVPGEKPGASR